MYLVAVMPVALCSRLFLLSDFGIRVGESLHVFMLSDSGQIKEPDYALCLVLCDVDLISSVTSPMPVSHTTCMGTYLFSSCVILCWLS